MKVMRMQLPYSLDDLRVAVVEWLRANDFHDDVHFAWSPTSATAAPAA
jgi:hypothetical protein